MTGRSDPMDRVTFETDHLCDPDSGAGDTHIVSGWQTRTPGLAVFHNAGPNVPCHPDGDPDDPTYGSWLVWNTAHRCMVMGADDPESAMRYADQLGRYRDWEGPPDAGPPLLAMLDDIDERGEW